MAVTQKKGHQRGCIRLDQEIIKMIGELRVFDAKVLAQPHSGCQIIALLPPNDTWVLVLF